MADGTADNLQVRSAPVEDEGGEDRAEADCGARAGCFRFRSNLTGSWDGVTRHCCGGDVKSKILAIPLATSIVNRADRRVGLNSPSACEGEIATNWFADIDVKLRSASICVPSDRGLSFCDRQPDTLKHQLLRIQVVHGRSELST